MIIFNENIIIDPFFPRDGWIAEIQLIVTDVKDKYDVFIERKREWSLLSLIDSASTNVELTPEISAKIDEEIIKYLNEHNI